MQRSRRKLIRLTIIYALVLLILAWTLGPLVWLFITSPKAAVEGFRVLYHPSRKWPTENLKTRLVAVQMNPAAGDSAAKGKGRMVVVGSTDFAADNFFAPENGTFIFNSIDWLSQDDAFISIRSKNRTPPKLLFPNAATQDAVKYLNVIGVPVLLILLASVRLWRRRRLQRRPYGRTLGAFGPGA